jgi:hypothetical protein
MASTDTTSPNVSLELIGRNVLEMRAEMRTARMEMGLLRSLVQGLEGRLIDAISDRTGRFEIRMEDQLGRFQARVEERMDRLEALLTNRDG